MPAVFTAWPTDANLTDRLTALGVTLPTGLTASEVIAQAVSDWERATHWTPFLAEASPSTTRFDYSGGTLDLRGGYVSVTSVTANIDDGYAGDVLTEVSDWYKLPSHAPAVERPYTHIGFTSNNVRIPNSIEIVGTRGFASTIPEDAWWAVLDRAVRKVVEFADGVKGTVVEYQQDTVRKKFAGSQGNSWIDRNEADWRQKVMRYKRGFA